ncbi:MAG: HEAT repeat domain-containing protein [Verrucomicrobiota bacterium]
MAFKPFHHFGFAVLALLSSAHAAEPLLQLKKGDHIAIVGSGLADRQQHHAWFEALIHKAFADDDLTIRNLGFAADEINVHPRSKGVPPVEWFLSMKKGDTMPDKDSKLIYKAGSDFGTDVILAYWGFNESFRGPQGIEDFKKNLGAYLDKLKAANFSGEGAPRILLFSPIAQEDLGNPNFTDGEENNRNLGLYTQVMADIAKARKIPFVNLFNPSGELYQKSDRPLTINGIHLTDEGDKLLAPIQFEAVFGKEPAALDDPSLAKIRDAVIDKNTEWHHRYRTVDQYNIYGDRGLIDYAGVTNNFILTQEMAQRDVKTANRDQRVWAVAKGGDLKVTDDNLPPVNLTPTNRKDEVPYMDPEEAIKYLKLAPGCKVELVASEKTFPEFVNPVQMNFDTKGRLWIAVWPNYPETSPTTKIFDKIVVIDLDPKTGKAAKMTTFADGLNCPTGFQFYKDGILLMQSPDLLYLRDTDGDGKADTRERVLHGLDAADSHHETNSICYEPGGAVYLSDGVFHRTNVETFNGPVRNVDGGIYRYEPVTGKFMRHAPYNLANPHGRVFDYWGNDLITDATGNANYFGPAMSSHLDSGEHPTMKQFWDRPSRPCPGTAILTSRHFPDDWQGLFLNTNVISIQGIFRAKLTEEGSGITGETLPNLVETDIAKNPNFRPSGITVAPDGSLYFMDWSQMLIGHLQHHLRDPQRDHQHGRLYRITYEGRPLMVPKQIDGQPVAALLDLLKEPENDVRLRAKIELGKHDAKEVTDGVLQWMKTLDTTDGAYEHHLLEALWVHQWHNVVNLPLLERVLKSPEPRARAQGIRVLGYWRDRVPGAVAIVKAAADDEAPRVRLEAVRVASYFRETAAADAALTVLRHPSDYYLDYCFKETMRQLQPWWKDAVAEGKEIAADNPAGISFLLDSVSSAELMKLPKSPVTLTAILTRPDMKMEQREVALSELAKLKKTPPTHTLAAVLMTAANKDDAGTRDLCTMLLRQSPADLKSSRAPVQKLAAADASDRVRQSATAALITADHSMGAAWNAAIRTPEALTSFLDALPLVPDEKLRGSAYNIVRNLLTALPGGVSAALKDQKGSSGRFIRIELPRKGTLSLAEVEVFSKGGNIAASGKATQQSIGYNGAAQRAIDGKTDGGYDHDSVTHTDENVNNPWWELDLGSPQPVESIVIWNRTDGPFGERMEGFDLTILDAERKEIFRKSGNPAPKESVRIEVQNDDAGNIRRAVIRALPSLGKEPKAVLSILTDLIAKNDQVPTAAQAMTKLPGNAWPKDQAAVAAKGIVEWARTVPADGRTTSDYADTIQIANKLIARLPADQAAAAKKALGDLNVRTFTIKAVPEQLRYDTARLVVEAGKPFEVVFENPDAMPHNLVFVMPGTMQDVATAVQTQAPDKLDSKGRAYVPDNDPRILDATKLVEAGKSETLHLTAPSKEDTYQFVCTFPGHWAIMKGELIVTKDVKAWLAAHPEK